MPGNSYEATCRFCGETVVTGETLIAQDLERLGAHLKQKHPLEVASIRTWRSATVRQYFRIAVVSD
jgi:hypothetical protein